MFKKLKENKKGFTLVELIVVLVILAILAALLVPALTGYIDRAKNKAIIAETRQTVMATQTLVDEEYAKLAAGSTITFTDNATATAGQIKVSDVKDLAEVTGTFAANDITVADAKVTKLVYKKGNKTCTYEPANAASNTDGDYNVQ